MQSNKITQPELEQFFENAIKNPTIVNPKQMMNYKEETFGSSDEDIESFVKLPAKLKAVDFAYHQIDDFYLFAICGGNTVMFVHLDPKTGAAKLFPHRYTILFPSQDLVEDLRVIKAGYIFHDSEGLKREEVFVTAGKFGCLYIFKVLKITDSFKMNKIEGHFNEINDLCFSPAELRPDLRNLVASCSNDGSIMIWNIVLGRPIICLKPNKLPLDDILAVDWEYPGDTIVSAHLDAVRVWTIDESVLEVIEMNNSVSKKENDYERRDFHGIEAKIKNFHDFYIDYIKMLPNNCIVTKSVDGAIIVWAYQQISPKEWHIIPFNKYTTLSSRFSAENRHSYFKVSVNPYDQLIVAPAEKRKIRVFNPRSSEPIAYKKFNLKEDDETSHILKALILNEDLDYIFALGNNGKLWYHKIQELDLPNQ